MSAPPHLRGASRSQSEHDDLFSRLSRRSWDEASGVGGRAARHSAVGADLRRGSLPVVPPVSASRRSRSDHDIAYTSSSFGLWAPADGAGRERPALSPGYSACSGSSYDSEAWSSGDDHTTPSPDSTNGRGHRHGRSQHRQPFLDSLTAAVAAMPTDRPYFVVPPVDVGAGASRRRRSQHAPSQAGSRHHHQGRRRPRQSRGPSSGSDRHRQQPRHGGAYIYFASLGAAATVIQRWFRGHRVRKRLLVARDFAQSAFGTEFVATLVDGYLEQELIPDLLIDLIRDDELEEAGSGHEAVLLQEMLGLVDETLPLLVKSVVIEANRELLQSYFLGSAQALMDPVEAVAEDLMLEQLTRMGQRVVMDIVAETVEDHLLDQRVEMFADHFLREEVAALCAVTVADVAEELRWEGVWDSVAEDVLAQACQETAVATLEEAGRQVRAAEQQAVVDFAAGKLVDRLLLDRLVAVVATQGDGLLLQDHAQRAVDRVATTMLLAICREVGRRQAEVSENVVTRQVHQLATGQAALDVLFEELEAIMGEASLLTHQQEVRRREVEQARLAVGGPVAADLYTSELTDLRDFI